MLRTFLNPKSVAIIGASKDKKKLGWQILDNLKSGGFKGKIYPVNLKEKSIEGFKAYNNIKNIAKKIDLAIIVIPAVFVLKEIKNCAEAGIKNIIVISAGFSEDGQDGKKLEEDIKKMAKSNKLNILGPNCLGVISGENALNATFAKSKIIKGNIAFISQSGAIGSAILDWAQDKNIGFSHFISIGNKAVLNENDFLKYFKNDSKTNFIIVYLEEIEDGQKFMEIVSALSKVKPVVVLKAGKTEAGKNVALSHTGSMAGSNLAVEAGLKRAGAIIIDSIEDAFNLIKFSQKNIKPANSDIFIISNAGGPAVVVADQIEKSDLKLGIFSKNIESELKKNFPKLATIKNPFDILGDAGAERYQKAMECILKDKKVSNLLILLTPQSSTEIFKTAEIICKLNKKFNNKLICVSFVGGNSLNDAKKYFEKNNIISFDYPGQAIKSLAYFLNYKDSVLINKKFKAYKPDHCSVALLHPDKENKNVKKIQLDYLESLKMLKKYNIGIIKTDVIENINDLKKIKYPIVLKIVGPKLIHKTDKKCIALNIENKREAEKVFNSFISTLRDKDNYCVAQEMIKNGFEMIVGFKRDKSFGSIIMVGMGGIYAEIFKDIKLDIDDVDMPRAMDMIKKLKIYPILVGARGQSSFDIKSLASSILDIARLAKDNPEIQELDINPLFVKNKGVKAVDVRIIK